jgi:hypothetical protein
MLLQVLAAERCSRLQRPLSEPERFSVATCVPPALSQFGLSVSFSYVTYRTCVSSLQPALTGMATSRHTVQGQVSDIPWGWQVVIWLSVGLVLGFLAGMTAACVCVKHRRRSQHASPVGMQGSSAGGTGLQGVQRPRELHKFDSLSSSLAGV